MKGARSNSKRRPLVSCTLIAALISACGAQKAAPVTAASTRAGAQFETQRATSDGDGYRDVDARRGTSGAAPGIAPNDDPQGPQPGQPPPAPSPAPATHTATPAGVVAKAAEPPDQPDKTPHFAIPPLQWQQLEAETQSRDCTIACRALGSMDRAAGAICAMSSDTDNNCASAQTRLRSARRKVRATCTSCDNVSVDEAAHIPSR
jgi:hypothetical protein